MRRISTGAEHLLTSAAIADEVIAYAAALARASSADTVVIPVVGDGGLDEARLLLGPASQITIVPDDSDEQELPGELELLADLREREIALGAAGAAPHPDGEQGDYFPDFDKFD